MYKYIYIYGENRCINNNWNKVLVLRIKQFKLIFYLKFILLMILGQVVIKYYLHISTQPMCVPIIIFTVSAKTI